MSVSVTITGPSTACLYCNTEDVAFGPVFDSEYDATDFLEHLREIGERDPRVIPAVELATLKGEWEQVRFRLRLRRGSFGASVSVTLHTRWTTHQDPSAKTTGASR